MHKHDMNNKNTFQAIGLGLYFAIIIIEAGMYFVLLAQGMIFQSKDVYFWRYFFRPVLVSTLIMFGGAGLIRVIHNEKVQRYISLLMVTLMLSNVTIVHKVFLVASAVFCIPIFLSIVHQDKKLLDLVTLVSEATVLYIAVKSKITNTGASNMDYFIPSVILIMVILFACRMVAKMCIGLLNARTIAMVQAMEEAQKAQKEADRSNQAKSLFLSNMSHEIRTPINAVLGMDEIIVRESTEDSIRDYALDIRSAGKTLLALVNDVLDFSKIESGKLDLLITPYDVSSMINDLVNMIATRASDKGLSFVVDVDPEIPHLLVGDEVRIKQIILNLLSNAVKYTERGEVKLCIGYEKIREDVIRLCIMVRDTGKGIKEEDMPKLFAPFERIEEKRNRNIEGTGLGMSITKRLLDLMDSELKVESVYGLGSDFSFEIVQQVKDWKPVGDYQETYRKIKEREKNYRAQFSAPDARILVVDDTPMNLKVFVGLLKRTGVQIDTAQSGSECLRLASENSYHMIFVDHMMPDMDGIETMKHLKTDAETERNQKIPVIALTANAVEGSREYYLQEGFDEYLMKPIESAKLERMLIRFLPEDIVTLS